MPSKFRQCGIPWNWGLWYCLGCWEPLTMSGVNDRLTFLRDAAERKRELEDRYGLTTTRFQAKRENPGSAVCSITARQPKRPPQAPTFRPPTVAVVRPKSLALSAVAKWQPKAASSTARSADCVHLEDQQIRKLQQGAVSQGYKSHTDRYDKDDTCRANCFRHLTCPAPRYLQYITLEWANVEGPDHAPGYERHG